MIKLTPKQQQKINEAAIFEHPLEMCGVLTSDDFIKLDNISDNPEKSFLIDPIQYAKVAGRVVAIIHSHTKDLTDTLVYDICTPSRADIDGQKRSGLPWLIVGTEGEECTDVLEIPRTPSRDYLGRAFIWFINDCYTLVKDYYQFEFGVNLVDYDATFDWRNLISLNNVLVRNIVGFGFKEHDGNDYKNGDLLLISCDGLRNNHLGIYHNGEILHQLGISVLSPFSDYQTQIEKVLRYAG